MDSGVRSGERWRPIGRKLLTRFDLSEFRPIEALDFALFKQEKRTPYTEIAMDITPLESMGKAPSKGAFRLENSPQVFHRLFEQLAETSTVGLGLVVASK